MSDFLQIELIAGVSETQSLSKINNTIKSISARLEPIKLGLDIDQKALNTIKTFNTEMQRLAHTAQGTKQAVGQMTTPITTSDQLKGLQQLISQYDRLGQAGVKSANALNTSGQGQVKTLRDLETQYTKLNRIIKDYNSHGEATRVQHQFGDKDGNLISTVTTDGSDNILKIREHDVERHKLLNDQEKQIAREREKIADRIANIRRGGYGDEGLLGSFEKQATSNNISAIQTLSKEVDNYGKSLTSLPKKSDLQQTVDSLKELNRAGAIELPKNSSLAQIEKQLAGANTTKEIKDVESSLANLQSTMSKTDREMTKIQGLRAENLLPKKEIDEAQRRLKSAVTPTDVEVVSKDIKGLQERNNNIKRSNQELKKHTDERQDLYRRLADLERLGADSKTTQGFRSRIDAGDVNSYKELNRQMSDYNKHLKDSQYLEQQQRAAVQKVDKLRSSVVGAIPEDLNKGLDNYTKSMESMTATTPGMRNEVAHLNKNFSMLDHEIMKADQGMARFGRQMQSAMVRIPIYAAGMAAMYAPLRMFQSAIQQIIEIDTQMTVLERVTDGAESMNTTMTASIGIAERLGNTIAEVNEGLVNFARQGYRGEDLTAITEVATVMSNVSDLDVESAAGSLTAAMKGFNIEAQDSIRIVDALNEVNIKSASCYSNVA